LNRKVNCYRENKYIKYDNLELFHEKREIMQLMKEKNVRYSIKKDGRKTAFFKILYLLFIVLAEKPIAV